MSFNLTALLNNALAPQNLLLAGVGVNVAATIGRAVFHTPKQKAQIDAIEGKVNSVLNQVQQVLPAVQKASQNVNRADPRAGSALAAGVDDLSLALNKLPADGGATAPGSNSSGSNSSAQGGAS